tara:strand:- start:12493 stop:12717 length:225 start_codon:yes stop_codon:yes gene_type:complete
MTEEVFVPIEKAAKHFGISVSTFRSWVRSGAVPRDTYVKVGNTYRFNLENVSTALTKQPEEPIETMNFDDDEDF